MHISRPLCYRQHTASSAVHTICRLCCWQYRSLSISSVCYLWRDWLGLRASVLWGRCEEGYVVYTVRNVHTVHTVQTVHTVHTIHTVLTVYNAHILHTVYTVHISFTNFCACFFTQHRAVYGIIWKEYGAARLVTDGNTIWCMCCSCCINIERMQTHNFNVNTCSYCNAITVMWTCLNVTLCECAWMLYVNVPECYVMWTCLNIVVWTCLNVTLCERVWMLCCVNMPECYVMWTCLNFTLCEHAWMLRYNQKACAVLFLYLTL